MRPDRDADEQVTEHRRQMQAARQHHHQHGAGQQHQHQL